MAKSDAIELQQPLDYADGASGASDAAKEDMARLGKKQKLKVRGKTRRDKI
jgi:hypothetical protein